MSPALVMPYRKGNKPTAMMQTRGFANRNCATLSI